MGSVRKVTVEWKDHGDILKKGLLDLFREEILVDSAVTFYGERIKVHRLILAIFLPAFRQSFYAANACGGGSAELDMTATPAELRDLKEMNLDYVANQSEDVQALVEFIYTGKTTVPEERLVYLTRLASDLHFDGLLKAITRQFDHSEPVQSQVESEQEQSHDGKDFGRRHIQRSAGDKFAAEDMSAALNLVDVTLHVPADDNSGRQRKSSSLRRPRGARTDVTATSDTVSSYDEVLNDYVGNNNADYGNSVDATTNDSGGGGDQDDSASDDGDWWSERKRQRGRKTRRKLTTTTTNTTRTRSKTAAAAASQSKIVPDKVKKKAKNAEVEEDDRNAPAAYDNDASTGNNDMPTCDKCGLMFLTVRNLQKHRKSCGQVREQCCKYCPYRTTKSDELKEHLAEHKKDLIKNFKCPLCTFIAHAKYLVRAHVIRMHGKSCGKERQFACKFCPYSTTKREELKEHTTNEHRNDFFKCSQCKFASPEKYLLRAHMLRMHLANKTHKCPDCNYSSMSKALMKRHFSLKHLKEKNHMCETCGKCFQTANKLNGHVRFVHQGIKQYKCKYCDKEFNWYTNFKVHVGSKHTGDVIMYMCDMCGKSYNRRWNLNAHMRRVHGVSLEPTRNYEVPRNKAEDHNNVVPPPAAAALS